MKTRWWITFCAASLFTITGPAVLGQGHGHGHGEGKHEDDHDSHARFDDHDRGVMRGWYEEHERDHGRGEGLPPGLAKRDQLSPGLERQLVVRGKLPPGLQKRIRACPEDLERRLPPPPPNCEHVIIGGHIVLLNRSTYVVLDIFHVELR
jgi:hypothetical protein